VITYLDVPFHESAAVRNLGAKWNMGLKKWYVPDGVDLYPFYKWVPGAPKLSKKVEQVLKRKNVTPPKRKRSNSNM
jgi:hypothetical protein